MKKGSIEKETVLKNIMDYVDIIQVGVRILLLIAIGFICIKFEFVDKDVIPNVNRFLLNCCYPALIFRSVAATKIKEINFIPFAIGGLVVISLYIVCAFVFLIPNKWLKNRFYYFLSTSLPSNYTNYLIIGLPFFTSMWPGQSNVMITVINLSNDLVCVPIFLISSNLYQVHKSNQMHKANKDGIVEKFDFKMLGTILLNIVKNPIIIGNVVGFIWSGAGWSICPFLQHVADFMADGVLALCLFCVGGFLSQYSLIACPWLQFVICVILRDLVMPLFGFAYAKAFKLDKDLAYQCTLMPMMPSATASFMLTYSNNCGPGVSSTMIFWSTVLVVPAMIAWIAVIDSLQPFG